MSRYGQVSFGFRVVQLTLAFVMILVGGFAVYVSQQDETTSTESQASGSQNALVVSLSTEPSSEKKRLISLPTNKPTRYYVHVTHNGNPIETNFDVKYNWCESGSTCFGMTDSSPVTSPWFTFRSDSNGVARIDQDDGWLEEGIMGMQLRPHGDTSFSWSNKVDIVFDSDAPQSTRTVNALNFLKMVPGNIYVYKSINNKYSSNADRIGRTFLQMEQMIEYDGIRIIPWRFTKDSQYDYWDNRMGVNFNDKSNIFRGGNEDLRWFIVDPRFNYAARPNYNNFIWGYGDIRYRRRSSDGPDRVFSDSLVSKQFGRYHMGTIPGYNLSKKTISIPYVEERSDLNWKVRIEMDRITVNGDGFSCNNCEVLRVDYYEGDQTTAGTEFYKTPQSAQERDAWFHRESWYYARNIGLVMMKGANYNGYGGMDLNDSRMAPKCSDVSFCWSDTITEPHRELILEQYFDNPTLQVKVSTDNVNFSNQITIQKGQPYFLKVTNVPYTGFLESQNGKWPFWIENGTVEIPGSVTADLGAAVYNSEFRVWIPDEQFAGESRVGSNTLPFSNQVTITIVDSTPEPTHTPRPEPTTTPVPPQPTSTLVPPIPTNTPRPVATSTPLPTATDVPLPTVTPTPPPLATNTPIPVSPITPTPVPIAATNTPIPVSPISPTATNTVAPTQGSEAQGCLLKGQGDVNCDGLISIVDYSMFIADFALGTDPDRSDFNTDGKVTVVDYSILIQNYVP